jgi:hypothetical protein
VVKVQGHSGVFLEPVLRLGSHISPAASTYLKSMKAEMSDIVIFNGFGKNTPYGRFDYLVPADGLFVEYFFYAQSNTVLKGQKMLNDLLPVSNDKIIIANSQSENIFWNATDHAFSLAAFLLIANENSYYPFLFKRKLFI